MIDLSPSPTRPSQGVAYLRLPAVIARYGCCRATIYAWIATGDFPPPVKLGRRLAAWRLEDLESWEAARAAPRRLS